MSLLLLLETSTETCSVGLARAGEIWVLRESSEANQHAQQLTIFIQKVLQDARVQLADIQGIVVSAGPGSYTGLRIAVSVAKGICYGLDIPLLGVDTLQALAWGMQAADLQPHPKRLYVPMIDARRKDAYLNIYNTENQPIIQTDCYTLTADFFQKYTDEGYEVLIGGNAARKFEQLFGAVQGVDYSPVLQNSARFLPALAMPKYQQKQFENLETFEPLYLKLV
jgi:tRNA threonylcarbamoyladenosine biosynthesis protein TsaB